MKRKRPTASPEAAAPLPSAEDGPRWPLAGRVAFRFAVVYLGLFCLATQISGSMTPNVAVPYRGLGRLPPMRDITEWTARSVLGITAPLGEGSAGEPLFFWAQLFWMVIAAAAAAAVWSALDRQRANYARLHAWVRLFARFALAASLFEYGMTKVIPTQFPAPSLTTLVTPAGDLTLSAMLWASIGAAPAYQIFTGCIELLAGVLLLVPRTTMLGAAIGLGAMTQVFVLNMTYDVGLKATSFHLIVLAIVLLLPDARRLADFFLNRPVAPAAEPRLARTARGARILLTAQLAVGVYLLAMYAYANWSFWYVGGGGQPKSELYGIWDVERLAIDGERRVPQLNDYDRRWRRVIFDDPDAVVFQRTDDSFARYGASIDPGRGAIALTKGNSRSWRATLQYDRPVGERLRLIGEMDGQRIELDLRQVNLDTFRLLNSGFRWVRPH